MPIEVVVKCFELLKGAVILLGCLIVAQPSFAGPRGTESGGGGGDPDVTEFLKIGNDFLTELKAGKYPSISASADTIETTIKTLTSSLEGKQKAKLRFTRNTIFDFNLVEKWAFYRTDDTSILVSRKYWRPATLLKKRELVIIELAGLSGSPVRYEDALKVTAEDIRRMHEGKARICGFDVPRESVGHMRGLADGDAHSLTPYVSDGFLKVAHATEVEVTDGLLPVVICQEGATISRVVISPDSDGQSSVVNARVWAWKYTIPHAK